MSEKFKQWMDASTTLEKEILASQAQTAMRYLYALSNGERTASADVAGRMEQSMKELRKKSKGRLPKVTRVDLCPACAACPYSPKCSTNKTEI